MTSATSITVPAFMKALARAHRWQRMLDNGRYASISEMAAAERIDRGYLGRVLQLTLLAPDIVEAILDGQQPEELGMPKLMRSFSVDWPGQRTAFADAAYRESPWASWPSRGS